MALELANTKFPGRERVTVPSAERPELSKALSVKPGEGSIYISLHVVPAAFPVYSTSFSIFQIPLKCKMVHGMNSKSDF